MILDSDCCTVGARIAKQPGVGDGERYVEQIGGRVLLDEEENVVNQAAGRAMALDGRRSGREGGHPVDMTSGLCCRHVCAYVLPLTDFRHAFCRMLHFSTEQRWRKTCAIRLLFV